MDDPKATLSGIVSFFSENRKEGRWAVPRHLRVLSVFASLKSSNATVTRSWVRSL